MCVNYADFIMLVKITGIYTVNGKTPNLSYYYDNLCNVYILIFKHGETSGTLKDMNQITIICFSYSVCLKCLTSASAHAQRRTRH